MGDLLHALHEIAVSESELISTLSLCGHSVRLRYYHVAPLARLISLEPFIARTTCKIMNHAQTPPYFICKRAVPLMARGSTHALEVLFIGKIFRKGDSLTADRKLIAELFQLFNNGSPEGSPWPSLFVETHQLSIIRLACGIVCCRFRGFQYVLQSYEPPSESPMSCLQHLHHRKNNIGSFTRPSGPVVNNNHKTCTLSLLTRRDFSTLATFLVAITVCRDEVAVYGH